ncbi:MAG: 5'-nucleotidase C-terminal domain-containing protein [Candidatus Cryptobacteroides sp.]|nr:5'-nucleotidase C-terminal domain-containing protein [Candidatus Cryptobacteroides sp.]
MNRHTLLLFLSIILISIQGCAPKSDELHIVTTGDVHGRFFSIDYSSDKPQSSLEAVKCYTDSLRSRYGAGNVLLLDAGDILQGDNTAYYFNYVDTVSEHIYPRIADYMGYDAVTLGNHDIETGHAVYDRVAAQLENRGIPTLSGNVVNASDGQPYFPYYTMVNKGGRKIAVLGFNNANIKAWLPEKLWSGLNFVDLMECVQQRVDEVRATKNPDLLIVVVHSGTGLGDGSMLENQSLDLLHSLKGVDILVGAHDHRPYTETYNGCIYIDGGARAQAAGHATINFKTGSRTVEIARMDRNRRDVKMEETFASEIGKVREFTNAKVGALAMELRSDAALGGMCDYINLLQTVQLDETGADISFAAPIGSGRLAKAGKIVVNDLFKIYPYENQLFVLSLSGKEIKDYLEYSYGEWLAPECRNHLLGIQEKADERTGNTRWSLTGRSYNFDAAAGLIYTVDINKPQGKRVSIKSLANGEKFNPDSWYNVAMTSYRATGGGDLLIKGAGIPADELSARVVSRHIEIRELIKRFFLNRREVTPESAYDAESLGSWKFIPETKASELFEKDRELLDY